MNELKVIENVKAYEEKGIAYLNAEDVARGLGFVQEKNNVEYVRWETLNSYLKDFGFSQRVGKDDFIPENMFYRLCMKAKNEIAESFQIKVSDVIIPSIRKNGGYIAGQEELKPEELIAKALVVANSIIENQKKELEQKTKTLNILTHVKKLYSTTEIAKEIGLKSAFALNKTLVNKKIQYKQNGTYVLYSKYSDLGYESIKQEVLDNGKVIYHRKWTQRGREFILNLLKGE